MPIKSLLLKLKAKFNACGLVFTSPFGTLMTQPHLVSSAAKNAVLNSTSSSSKIKNDLEIRARIVKPLQVIEKVMQHS